MRLRANFKVWRKLCGTVTAGACLLGSAVIAQESTPYFTDPVSGIVYRKVHRTIERPVVETQLRPQESTVYRPETVVTSRPETRTVYSPAVSYSWEPKVTNRWNPFAQPTVIYQHTPRMHWEAKTETVDRKEATTNWVAETRKVDVPLQIVKIQREERVDYEPVDRIAVSPQTRSADSTQAEIAARLRPMDPNYRYQPNISAPTSAYANSAPYRNEYQSGMKPNTLTPSAPPGYSIPLPAAPGVGIAGLPAAPIFR